MGGLIPFPAFLSSKQSLPVYNSSGDGKTRVSVFSDVSSGDYAEAENYYDGLSSLLYRNKTDFFSSAYYEKDGCVYGLTYDEEINELRIITGAVSAVPPYESHFSCGGAEIRFWQFETDHSLIDCGMCYLFQLSDYSFFVIDSAHQYSVNDDIRLYEFMRERTPSDKKVTVAGWFFTHGHDDHIAKFTDILRFNRDIVIESVYFNFAAENHYSSFCWDEALKHCIRNFREQLSLHPEIKIYNLHTGQKFTVRDLEFTVLCTHEDVYPQSVEDFNESSTVLMCEVCGSKICFPGDAGPEESEILERRYPNYLKCDIMQVSHHGHRGTTSQFYRLSAAPVILIPNTKIKWDEEYGRIEADRVAMSFAKHSFISSAGTVEFTFPLRNSVIKLYPDECIENFDGINALWSYSYTDEFKKNVIDEFNAQRGAIIEY